jgi:hypothetical protein
MSGKDDHLHERLDMFWMRTPYPHGVTMGEFRVSGPLYYRAITILHPLHYTTPDTGDNGTYVGL